MNGNVGDALSKPPLDPYAVVHLARSAEDVFFRCVDLAYTTTRATTALALLHRPGLGVLEVVAAAGHLAESVRGLCVRPGEALGWRVFASGEAALVSEARLSPDALFISGQRRAGMYLGVPLIDPDGRVFGVLSVDTTDSSEVLDEQDAQALHLLAQAAGVAYSRLAALEDAQRTARRFELLARLSAEIEPMNAPEEIAGHALEMLLELTGFTLGGVYQHHGGGLVTMTELAGPTVDFDVEREKSPHPADGILAQVISSGETQVIPDHQQWRGAHGLPPSRIRSFLATPLRSQGEVVGVIGLAHLEAMQDLSPETVQLLEMVAARIERSLERSASIDRLRRTREAALRALGRQLELRDDETFGHTDRVTELALRLGRSLGLDAESLQSLRWGAYLHDVGKVAVPDQILRKPGAFTPAERAVMQTHVVLGDEMLQDEDFVPRAVREIVRHHHERWDGGGYPDGLAGDRIPLLARLFSVVDVYDALISERPYKLAWTPEAARAELIRCAGHQFDPELVQAFLRLESTPD